MVSRGHLVLQQMVVKGQVEAEGEATERTFRAQQRLVPGTVFTS